MKRIQSTNIAANFCWLFSFKFESPSSESDDLAPNDADSRTLNLQAENWRENADPGGHANIG